MILPFLVCIGVSIGFLMRNIKKKKNFTDFIPFLALM